MSIALRQIVSRCPASSRLMATAQAGEHGEAAFKLWKNLSLFVALPIVGLVSVIVLRKELTEPHARPEFKPYDHLRIRRKNFPWGDGKKTFFHNPHVNALPTGYEEEH